MEQESIVPDQNGRPFFAHSANTTRRRNEGKSQADRSVPPPFRRPRPHSQVNSRSAHDPRCGSVAELFECFCFRKGARIRRWPFIPAARPWRPSVATRSALGAPCTARSCSSSRSVSPGCQEPTDGRPSRTNCYRQEARGMLASRRCSAKSGVQKMCRTCWRNGDHAAVWQGSSPAH